MDRLTSEVSPRGSVSYSYNAVGRRPSMTVSGQSTISYFSDNANHLTQITQGSANVMIVPDGDGRRQSLTLPNAVKMAYVQSVFPATGTTNYPTNGVIVVRFTESLQRGVSLTAAQNAIIAALPSGCWRTDTLLSKS